MAEHALFTAPGAIVPLLGPLRGSVQTRTSDRGSVAPLRQSRHRLAADDPLVQGGPIAPFGPEKSVHECTREGVIILESRMMQRVVDPGMIQPGKRPIGKRVELDVRVPYEVDEGIREEVDQTSCRADRRDQAHQYRRD